MVPMHAEKKRKEALHEPQGRAGCPQPAEPRRGEDTAPYQLAWVKVPMQGIKAVGASHEPRALPARCRQHLGGLSSASRFAVGRRSSPSPSNYYDGPGTAPPVGNCAGFPRGREMALLHSATSSSSARFSTVWMAARSSCVSKGFHSIR